MVSLCIDCEGIRRSLRVKLIPFTAAENRAHTRPCIGRKTGARNWVTQGKRTEDGADRVVVIDSSFNKYRDRLVLEDVETGLVSIQCKSLKTDTSVGAEEIFDVAASSP